MKKSALVIFFVFICVPSLVFAQNSRSLDLGDASGSTGQTVYLPLTISGTGGEVGGIAFTLEFDSTMFEVVGIRENSTSTPEVVDPEIYCGTLPCDNPYTTTNGSVGTGALFFQFNDDGSGKALVASAAAEPTPDNVTLMEIGFQINGSVATETIFDINLSQTQLPQNTAAGYDAASNPIPVLSGLPSLTADTNGDYPVSDTFSVSSLDGGVITVEPGEVCSSPKGDVDGLTGVSIQDVSYLYFYVRNVPGYQVEECAGDIDGNPGISIQDVAYLYFHVRNVPGYDL